MTIKRRALLGGVVATAALASTPGLNATPRKKVGIIGGGIIGASLAARLAEAGADVILFEKVAPAAGATRKSVAWINPQVNDAGYLRLRLESMKAWLEDDRRWGMKATWGGSISWAYGAAKGRDLKNKADLLDRSDDPPRYLTAAEVTAVSPGIYPGDDVSLAFQTVKDGHVDPVHATECYLAAAKRFGAKIIYPCEVTALMKEGGRVAGVRTSKGNFPLDVVVTATGTDTPQLMTMAGRKLEIAHKPGLVVHTKPQPMLTRMVYEASGIVEFKQYPDGRFLASFTGGPPNLPQHAEILNHQMQYPNEFLRQHHAQMLIAQTAKYMPAIAIAEPTEILLGFRPYPLDNRPICGPVPSVDGLYVVVTHSGITLAPILSRYAAQEIVSSREAPLLAPYRPSRYMSA